MRILALDIATRFGYAVWDSAEGLVASGFGQLPADGPPGKRLAAFHLALRKLAPTVDRIAYEDAWHQKGKAGAVYAGLAAMMQVHAYQAGATLHPVAVSTLKKHATGDGRADKTDMIRAARVRWNLEPQTDDHADALCVLDHYLDQAGLEKAPVRSPKAGKAAQADEAGQGSARRVRALRATLRS